MAFFSTGSKTTLSCAYLWTELHKIGFLCFCRPFHLNRAFETGRHHYYQIGTVLAVFWRFFCWLQEDAAFRLPLDRIAPNSVSWAFAGHSTGIGCWKRKNISISRLPQFCSLEHFWRFFGRLQDDAVLRLPLDRITQNRFPVFLQAIPPESSVGNGKTPLLADWHGFGVFLAFFLAGSKTTLPFAFPWTELHQTRFPVFLQAIPPESSVGNGKTPLLADWHGFGGFLTVFRPAQRRRCPALTL